MALTTHTVTLRTEYPGGDPLDGTWSTSVYAFPPLVKDLDGHVVIAGKDPEPTIEGTGELVLTLEATDQPNLEPSDFRWQISFVSRDRATRLGPFVFDLTEDRTLDDIAESSGVPITSDILAQTLAARDATLAAAAGTTPRGMSVAQTEFDWDFTPGSDNSAALQAAVTAAGAAGVSLWIPGGEYLASGVELPTGTVIRGDGFSTTRLIRTTDAPIFTSEGTPYSGTGPYTPSVYGLQLENVGLLNDAPGSTTPLMGLTGASACHFDRVRWESYEDGAPLLEALQLWDSRFDGCKFHGGGSDTGNVGAVRLLAGYDDWLATVETHFTDCWWEAYYGPALETVTDAGAAPPCYSIQFINTKMESRITTGPHMVLDASQLSFENAYVTQELTTGPVVVFDGSHSVQGTLRFHQNTETGAVAPSAFVSIDADCEYFDLHVNVDNTQFAGANVVTMAEPYNPTLNVTVNAPEPLINGTNNKVHTIRESSFRQVVTATSDAPTFEQAKVGRAIWRLGTPLNPTSDWEDWYFNALAADGSGLANFFILRSRGASPAASYREIIAGAHVQVESGWNDDALLKLGGYTVFIDPSGVVRLKYGTPGSGTDGYVIGGGGAIVATTTELASAASFVNLYGKYAGLSIANSTTHKRVTTFGSAPTDVWYDSAGAVAHTPT